MYDHDFAQSRYVNNAMLRSYPSTSNSPFSLVRRNRTESTRIPVRSGSTLLTSRLTSIDPLTPKEVKPLMGALAQLLEQQQMENKQARSHFEHPKFDIFTRKFSSGKHRVLYRQNNFHLQ
jgi:hypothetical protein